MAYRRAALALLLFALVSCSPADGNSGRVVGVDDGDSLTVLLDGAEVRVRIHGIDSPERRQPFSNKARQALSEAVFGKTVRVERVDEDSYGRLVARVYLDDTDIGLQQVEQGFAWHYARYSDDESLAGAQQAARGAGRGLWQDKEPEAPWEYRKRMREEGQWKR